MATIRAITSIGGGPVSSSIMATPTLVSGRLVRHDVGSIRTT
jgi:hypothetical protein